MRLLQCTSGLKKIFTMLTPKEIVEVTKQLGHRSIGLKQTLLSFGHLVQN